jgi:hypothetical protein
MRAGLFAGFVACLPPLAFVFTRSSAHWGSMLLVGAVCAVGMGFAFAAYSRLAAALVRFGTQGVRDRRVRVAALANASADADARVFLDPLDEEDAVLEQRFAELESAQRRREE